MITDEEARDAVENAVSSIKALHSYCKDHDCAKCQFHGEYDKFMDEYMCSIWDLLNVRWYR